MFTSHSAAVVLQQIYATSRHNSAYYIIKLQASCVVFSAKSKYEDQIFCFFDRFVYLKFGGKFGEKKTHPTCCLVFRTK